MRGAELLIVSKTVYVIVCSIHDTRPHVNKLIGRYWAVDALLLWYVARVRGL